MWVKNKFKFLVCALSILAFSKAACAFSSIAVVDGNVNSTFSAAGNYETQEKADRSALAGCRANAKKNKLAKLAGKCEIVMRGKGTGYGAVVCATNGCNWSTGYESKQGAVDAAYNACAANYPDCQQSNIGAWADFAGFPSAAAPPPQPEMQTPPSMTDIYRARWCAKQSSPPPECR
ncbi:hypothetical protein AB3X82_23340 [Paraburkholderia phenoliruptrix]|uniref:DUF4189 domain-containing protein n=1 Tax=Paraburkholderia phenoliruptrix TaxID=252970 RepID=A0ABV3WJP3_9BURK